MSTSISSLGVLDDPPAPMESLNQDESYQAGCSLLEAQVNSNHCEDKPSWLASFFIMFESPLTLSASTSPLRVLSTCLLINCLPTTQDDVVYVNELTAAAPVLPQNPVSPRAQSVATTSKLHPIVLDCMQ
jgi:hypothetical protein